MSRRFIDLDLGPMMRSIRTSVEGVEKARKVYEAAAQTAVVQYAEHIVGIAGQRAPIGKSGELRASGTTQGPEIVADGFVVWAAFNIVYARMRDVGGTIYPVRAQALFIPLKDGVRPGQDGLKWGEDFVLAKKVVQVGNRYWSGTLDENLPMATALIGKNVQAIATRAQGGQT